MTSTEWLYIDKYLRVVVKYPTYPSSKISGWVYCNLGCTFPWIMDLVTSQVVTEAALNEKLAERKEGHHLNLVGGFEHYLFSIIYGMSSFPLTNIFQDGYCTTNQIYTVIGRSWAYNLPQSWLLVFNGSFVEFSKRPGIMKIETIENIIQYSPVEQVGWRIFIGWWKNVRHWVINIFLLKSYVHQPRTCFSGWKHQETATAKVPRATGSRCLWGGRLHGMLKLCWLMFVLGL